VARNPEDEDLAQTWYTDEFSSKGGVGFTPLGRTSRNAGDEHRGILRHEGERKLGRRRDEIPTS
jgi:hypothetical protein